MECTKGASVMQQYWDKSRGLYQYIPVAAFADAYQQTQTAHEALQALEQPYVAPNPKCDDALFTHKYALPRKLACTLPGLPEHSSCCHVI